MHLPAQPPSLNTLAGRIGIVRRKRGLSARAVARHVGRAPQTVLNWEAGRAVPDATDLPRLAFALGVPKPVLIDGARDMAAIVAELTPAKEPGFFMTVAEVTAAEEEAQAFRFTALAEAAELRREGRRKAGETNRARRAAEAARRVAEAADAKARMESPIRWLLRTRGRCLFCGLIADQGGGLCSECATGGEEASI